MSNQSSSEDTAPFNAVNIAATVLFCMRSTALTMEPPSQPHTHSYPLFTIKFAVLQLLGKTATTSWIFVRKEKSQRPRNYSWGHCSDLSMVFHCLYLHADQTHLSKWSNSWFSAISISRLCKFLKHLYKVTLNSPCWVIVLPS